MPQGTYELRFRYADRYSEVHVPYFEGVCTFRVLGFRLQDLGLRSPHGSGLPKQAATGLCNYRAVIEYPEPII